MVVVGGKSTTGSSTSSSSAAADALALLLREDPRLVELQMTSFYNPIGGEVIETQKSIGTNVKDRDDVVKQAGSASKNYSLVSPNEEAAFAYAAALMNDEEEHGWMTPSPATTGEQGSGNSNGTGSGDVQSRAQEALAEVDRKLAMVSGLAERLVRDYPEGVSETLLKLHGCSLDEGGSGGTSLKRQSSTASQRSTNSGSTSNPQDELKNSEIEEKEDAEGEGPQQQENKGNKHTTTLLHMRDKCERLHRQADVLEGVANRVESSLEKQYHKLVICTTKLKRVLALSSTLKMAMRLQFESKKILGYGGLLRDLMESSSSSSSGAGATSGKSGSRSGSMLDVDLRDLTRAASSVATMEQLLADPELHGGGVSSSSDEETELVEVVEAMRPEVEKAALAVRRLAASLLEEQQSLHGASTSISRLGGILQIYFHLQELPQAVWSAVESSLAMGEKAAAQCFNPKRMGLLREQAKQQAKDALEADMLEQHVSSTGDGTDTTTSASPLAAQRKKKQQEQQLERYIVKKLKEQRIELANRWSTIVGEATQQIATLQRVLSLKSDPISRQSFLQVVTTSGNVPEAFLPAQLYLEEYEGYSSSSGGLSSLSNKKQQQQPIHILHLFWTQLSLSLGNRMSRLLRFEAGRLKNDVAALYPMLRAATLDMLNELGGETFNGSSTSGSNAGSTVGAMLPIKMDDDVGGGIGSHQYYTTNSSTGILGGSALLDQSIAGCSWTTSSTSTSLSVHHQYHHRPNSRMSADSWTVDPYYSEYQLSTLMENDTSMNSQRTSSQGRSGSSTFPFGTTVASNTSSRNTGGGGSTAAGATLTATTTTTSSSAALMRFEWKIFMGEYASTATSINNNNSKTDSTATSTTTSIGLWDLQNAFVEASRERLCSTLSQLFVMPEPTIDTLVGLDAATDGIGGLTTSTGGTGSGGMNNIILPTLPTRYDLAKLESLIKDELALADPRQGGGEFGMIKLLSNQVVNMVIQFCSKAQDATSLNHYNGGGGSGTSSSATMMGGGDITTTSYLRDDDWGPTELLSHDIKLAGVMSALAHAVLNSPDQTYLGPYRPSQSPPAQNEEASRLCRMALTPAVTSIDGLVKKSLVHPLCYVINKRLSKAFSKMHFGVYMEDNHRNASSINMSEAAATSSTTFVQSHLALLYDRIATQHLTKLPPEYASKVANTVCAYSMYAFVSNLALVRPLGETGRLKMTQDLADLELSLEQLVLTANSTGSTTGNSGWMGMLGGIGGGGGTTGSNPFSAAASASALGSGGGGGGSSPLGQIDGGKPYMELRAVRSMLFWNGLDEEGMKSPNDIAMELLDEDWMKDVRPSTVLHFLFSSAAPDLLSSPHHSKRMSAQDYVNTLVKYDGTVDDGEANAWMTTMACCDAYQQRESIEGRNISSGTSTSRGGGMVKGDRRVAAVLMALGSELLRRRRH